MYTINGSYIILDLLVLSEISFNLHMMITYEASWFNRQCFLRVLGVRLDGAGFEFPVGAKCYLLQNVQIGSGALQTPCSMGTGVLSRRYIGWGMKLGNHINLESRLRINGAIPLLPLYACMAWTETVLPFTGSGMCLVFVGMSRQQTVSPIKPRRLPSTSLPIHLHQTNFR